MIEQHEKKMRGINSMQIGDSYQHMLDSIGELPWDVTCYTSARHQNCTALYRISSYDRVIFRFDSNDILISVYR